MIAEALLGLIGSAGAGRIFHTIDSLRAKKEEDDERKHMRKLARDGQLHEYLLHIQSNERDGKTTPMGWTLCGLSWMFGFTACACAIYCFALGAVEVTIKDPNAEAGGFSIFGIIDWQFNPNRLDRISALGVGYLILCTLTFYLSLFTGVGSRKR